ASLGIGPGGDRSGGGQPFPQEGDRVPLQRQPQGLIVANHLLARRERRQGRRRGSVVLFQNHGLEQRRRAGGRAPGRPQPLTTRQRQRSQGVGRGQPVQGPRGQACPPSQFGQGG